MDSIISRVEGVITRAGDILTDNELYKNQIKKSGDCNFVTDVDYAVQEYLINELLRIMPGSNIITEESSQNQYSFDKPTWILDPVDGTTNLMHQYNHSAVSLALFTQGKPEMGIIYNPYSKEMFLGIANQGAYLNNAKINVSEVPVLKDGLIGFGTTPYCRDMADTTFKIVSDVFKESQEIRRSGSAALDIAYVACGRLEGFFELQLQPWDYAAGLIILKESGGMLSNWNGDWPSLIKPDSIIATNGLIHEELIRRMVI